MYTNVREVEISRKAEELITFYREQFSHLFGEGPVEEEEEDRVVARWLSQKYIAAKAKSLIQLYLTLDDDWLRKHGYPLKMMRRHINAIIVNNPKPKTHPDGKRARGVLHCDSCWAAFEALYPINTDWDKIWIKCPTCFIDNKPWKYPAKEEFEKSFGNFVSNLEDEQVFQTPPYDRVFKEKEPFPDRKILDYEIPND